MKVYTVRESQKNKRNTQMQVIIFADSDREKALACILSRLSLPTYAESCVYTLTSWEAGTPIEVEIFDQSNPPKISSSPTPFAPEPKRPSFPRRAEPFKPAKKLGFFRK